MAKNLISGPILVQFSAKPKFEPQTFFSWVLPHLGPRNFFRGFYLCHMLDIVASYIIVCNFKED